MPAERGKGAKKRSVKGAPAVPVQLGEDARVLELRLRATVRTAAAVPEAALHSVLHWTFCGEEKTLCLQDVFAKPEEEPLPKGKQHRRTPVQKGLQDGDVDVLLSQHQIRVDLPTLSTLLCEGGEGRHRVIVHAPPPPATQQPTPLLPQTEASGKGGLPSPSAAASRSKNGKAKPGAKELAHTGDPAPTANGGVASAPQGAGARGKRKVSASGSAPKGTPLASVEVSFIDVMHVVEHEYVLELDIPGMENVLVVLKCRDSCLTPLAVLKRFRPVCFTVRAVEHLPKDSNKSSVVVAIEGLCHRVVSPPLLCAAEKQTDSAGPADATSATFTATGRRPLFRTVRFLGDLPPLSVYQSALLDPVRVSVFHRKEDSSDCTQHQPSGGAKGNHTKLDNAVRAEKKDVSSTVSMGSGNFSVKDWITDKQTLFDEAVSVLPTSRAAAVASGPASCLTAGSTVTCTIDCFLPLPPLQHVLDSGEPAPKDALLTRGVAVLPYSAPWMAGALACLLRQLMISRRASKECDVHLYVEPPPPTQESQLLSSVVATAADTQGVGTTVASSTAAASTLHDGSVDVRGQSASTATNGKSSGGGSAAKASSKHDQKARQRLSPGSDSGEPDEPTGSEAAEGGATPPEADAAPRRKLWPFEEAAVRVVSPAGLSGFEVCDSERRIICIEGPACEVHRVFTALHTTIQGALSRAPAAPPSTSEGLHATTTAPAIMMEGTTGSSSAVFRLLMNPELFAGRRLYTTYPPLVLAPSTANPSDAVAPATPEEDCQSTQSSTAAALVGGGNDGGIDIDEMGGGCGGRIHRIRLRETITNLMAQQRYLLHRTLSEACLRCILQLHALAVCPTLREATARDMFPSATGIISLERSFGQTLELPDIFGCDAFLQSRQLNTDSTVSRPHTPGAVAAATAESDTWEDILRASASATSAGAGELTLAAALDPSSSSAIGCLVAFQGTLLTSKRCAIPPRVAARYPRALWMVADGGTQVLCAFGKDTPGGTIRYHVEGQVVQTGATRMLYVLDFHTLAKSFTSTHNPRYEKVLAERRRVMTVGGRSTRHGISQGAATKTRTPNPHADEGVNAATRTTCRAAAITWEDSDEDSDNDAQNPPAMMEEV